MRKLDKQYELIPNPSFTIVTVQKCDGIPASIEGKKGTLTFKEQRTHFASHPLFSPLAFRETTGRVHFQATARMLAF